MTHRDAHLLAKLKAHAAIVRPQLLGRFGLAPGDASREPCPACDGGGLVFRLRPNEAPPPEPASTSESAAGAS